MISVKGVKKMKNIFLETLNVHQFNELCYELEDPTSLIGPSLAMITGPAGRGKSEAARHYVIQNNAVYIPPLNIRTPPMVLREICFELCKVKPTRSDTCLTLIAGEMAKKRRLIIVDEADLLSMPILEMMRNINERFACPIVLIGEEDLKGRVEKRRRIASRIRRRLEFSPVSQADITLFFKNALDLDVSPAVTAAIHRHSNGDWRPVITMAIAIERAMKASDIREITPELVQNVTKHI